MHRGKIGRALACCALFAGSPVAAEVVDQDENGFVTRDQAIVEATPKQVAAGPVALKAPAVPPSASRTIHSVRSR